jgi:hypothetical protein
MMAKQAETCCAVEVLNKGGQLETMESFKLQ